MARVTVALIITCEMGISRQQPPIDIALKGMNPASDDDLVSSIAPDVVRYLQKIRFFEKLDDVLRPTGESRPQVQCCGSFAFSKSVLRECGCQSDEDLGDILGVLQYRGACCDCEVLYNVAESSRLKAAYWRNQVTSEGDNGRVGHTKQK
jgi:hypothetical protein